MAPHYRFDVIDRELVLKRIVGTHVRLVPAIDNRMSLVLEAHHANGHASPIKL